MPRSFGREAAGARTAPGRDGAKKLQRYAGGEKVRYFRDDDDADLATLVKLARHGDDAHDIDAAFTANVVADARYKGRGDADVDDEYEIDGGLENYEDRCARLCMRVHQQAVCCTGLAAQGTNDNLFEKCRLPCVLAVHAPNGCASCRRKRGTREKQQERQQRQAVSDAKRLNSIVDRCLLCFGSAKRRKELMLSIGRLTYMALPARGSLADGHVIITPTDHVASFRAADEDVFEELKNFRKRLIQMFAQQVRRYC
jgi:Protein similar to CwfJ C-terminus 1